MTVPDLIALASKPSSEAIGHDDTRDVGLQRPDENHLGQLAPPVGLLFGLFYYLFKGMFLWAILSLLTPHGLQVGFPLFNRTIVLRRYHRKGRVQE